jgi:signal transduction histidine kinase
MLRTGEMGIDWVPFLKSKRRVRMKSSKIFAGVTMALINVALCTVAVGQDKATAQEVVAKVREAASTLSKTGDLAQFQQKQGPWVWADTYIFIQNCDKKVIAAQPISPERVGQDFMSMKDTKGKGLFQKDFCDAAKKPSGVWSEYWWPKPGEKEGSRKLTYSLSATGTPYVVSAGVYDDKATIAELSKLTSGK